MKELMERIKKQAIHRGAGMIDVSTFLNHKVDTGLMARMGQELVRRLRTLDTGDPTMVVTVEVSGICLAYAVAKALDMNMLFMRKHKPITWGSYHLASAPSATHGGLVKVMVVEGQLTQADRVWLIDDFLWTAATISAAVRLLKMSRTRVLGIGVAIEKPGGDGRSALASFGVPVVSLARVTCHGGRIQVQEGRSD